MYKCLCGREFSVPLGRYLGMELLSHVALRVEHFEELPSCFQSSCTILHSRQQSVRTLISRHACQPLFLFFFYSNHPSECEVVPGCGLDLYP